MRLSSYQKSEPKGRLSVGILIVLLLLVTFLPRIAESSVKAIQPANLYLSAVVYAALMACAGYVHSLIRIYSSRNHRLISKKHSPQSIKRGVQLGLFMPVWVTVSIAIAFFSPPCAQISWIIFLIAYALLWRFTKDKVLI